MIRGLAFCTIRCRELVPFVCGLQVFAWWNPKKERRRVWSYEEMKKRRWTCIDILKCLAAIAVVEIHKPLEIQRGAEVLVFCRFAVPVFFIITGFFYPETVRKKRQWRQLGKILTITIGANLFYLLWKIFLALEAGKSIKEALLARLEERVPEDFILWNFSPLSPHLWYLQALLYVLVIAMVVEGLGLRKLAYLAVPLLLAGNLIRGNYSLLFFGKEDCHIYYARNFLYCGLPFFWMGCWFGEQKEMLLRTLDQKKMLLLLCGIPLSWKIALMERSWLQGQHALGTQEEYAGTIFLAVCIFLLFVGWQNFYTENLLTRALAKVGKEYSMLIYVLHYAVLQALSRGLKGRKTLLAKGYEQYGMMLGFGITVLLVAAYVFAREKMRETSRAERPGN